MDVFKWITTILSSPLFLTITIFVLLGIIMIVYGILGARIDRKKTILHRFSKKAEGKSFLDDWLDVIKFVRKSEEKIDLQLSILDMKVSGRTFTKLKLAAAFVGIAFSLYMKNWMIIVPMILISIQFPLMVVDLRVKRRLKVFNDQVLEAFQVFITDYTTSQSVQKTLINIIPKLRDPLKKEFERLSRNLHSGVPIEEAFMEFAERTQNKWVMIFSQMIITYYRQGGDFAEHLMKITRSITGEKILEEQNSTELASVSILNYVLNALVPIAYIMNRWMNPQDAAIFTETSSGRMIIFGITISTLISLMMGKKIMKG